MRKTKSASSRLFKFSAQAPIAYALQIVYRLPPYSTFRDDRSEISLYRIALFWDYGLIFSFSIIQVSFV